VPLLAVLVAVAALATGGWVVLGTGVLGVRSVRVEGARTLPAADVVAAAAIAPDTPLARLDTAAVTARVAALPAVASATVRRSWPHTVVVAVVERAAVAVVRRDRSFLLLDAAGVPFRRVPARPRGLLALDLRAPGPDDRATRAALAVARTLPPALRAKVATIAAPTPDQVELRLAGGRVVFWGDAADGDRKAVVATALLSRPGRRIDVSAPDLATVR
jgi:cell division protein FtsQ